MIYLYSMDNGNFNVGINLVNGKIVIFHYHYQCLIKKHLWLDCEFKELIMTANALPEP
jgi:hypothetical protein